ncbi:MAG: hypothetical protein U1A72_22060 [Sulfuritalea sp.]|nr:hypothetical protein [Sulfuritalea sp.]
MPIDNQIEIPQSFMLMHVTPGHDRPNASQEVILDRYERCEDMACMLTEHARAIAFKENFPEQEVLTRCHRGLAADPSNFSEKESAWIIRRLAELLGWTPLEIG